MFQLCDDEGEVLDSHTVSEKIESDVMGEWVKVERTFTDYPDGVAYLDFTHSGKSIEEQEGHYGPKMAASSIMISKNEAVVDWLHANPA